MISVFTFTLKIFQMKPSSGINVLHNLHGHAKKLNFLISRLKITMFSDCFISKGTRFHILGPRKESDSIPW